MNEEPLSPAALFGLAAAPLLLIMGVIQILSDPSLLWLAAAGFSAVTVTTLLIERWIDR